MIIVHLDEEFKDLLASLRCDERPDNDVKAAGREALEITECPCCRSDHLHGHGWRRRFVLRAWWDPSQWGSLWFWRVQCQRCLAVIPLVPDVSLPRLMYAAAVVVAVVVGRLTGASPKEFEPSRRTQDRWLARFCRWWAIAQAAGTEMVEVPSDVGDVDGLLRGVWAAARAGIRLVAPAHASLATNTVRMGAKRPTISAHQRCKMTSG